MSGALSTYSGVDTGTSTAGSYHSNYFASGWNVQLPTGYAGPSVRSIPPGWSQTGTVNCSGGNPVGMVITQGGNSGGATLLPTTYGEAAWSYNLTSGSYSIEVLCGSTFAVSYAPVSPTGAQDWACTVDGDSPFYCYKS